MKINSKSNTGRYLKISATIVVVLAILGYLYWAFGNDIAPSGSQSEDTISETQTTDDIDHTPATQDDQQQANEQKQASYAEQDTDDSPIATTPSDVSVVLTTYYIEGDYLRANGYVSGVIENGGTCTLVVTNESGRSVSATRQGHDNATNTTCGQSTIRLEDLTPGKWTPELKYSSDSAKGTTGPKAWEAVEVK